MTTVSAESAESRLSLAPRKIWVLLGLLFVGIFAIYLFFISAGFGTHLPPQTRYYTLLADGFLDGHLHLGMSPSIQLLAKVHPYDPALGPAPSGSANPDMRFWDTSLFKGQYYLYWGPLPAVLAAAVKLAAGRDMVIGDEHLVLAFVLGRLAVGMALFMLALKWLFPRLRPWMVAPALVVFGLVNPYPFGLGRAGVYEAAIEGAQFFLLAGLLLAFLGMRGGRSRRHELVLVFLAGCAWGAALACRISLVLAIGALVLATAWVSSFGAERLRREAALRFVWVGAPVAFSALLLGIYNHARFGSWIEFGATYQVTFLKYSFRFALFLPNIHAYLLRRFLVSCEFPFVNAPFRAITLTPDWVHPKEIGYIALESEVGLLVAAPCVLFGLVAVWSAAKAVLQSARTRPMFATSQRDRLYIWLVTACMAITLLAGVPALGMRFSTMRFLADFTSGALLTAVVGFWTLSSGVTVRSIRHAVHGAGAVLGLYAVVVGVLLGFQGGYYGSFQKLNPALHEKMLNSLSLCD